MVEKIKKENEKKFNFRKIYQEHFFNYQNQK